MKPIFKKLAQSEKNSLDLDRPAEGQDVFGIYGYGSGSGSGCGNGNQSSHSSHDVVGRRAYHARSTSGTSQFSTATTGSGARVGSFVHPFQQTPRPYTPPLSATSYQTSFRESEHSHSNSPLLTEDEGPDQLRYTFRSNSNLSNRKLSFTANSNSHPTPAPTTTSQIVGSPPLRIQTKLPATSPLALATSHTSLANSLLLSSEVTSPIETMPPASAIRTSIDKGFCLRSRSEVDARVRSTSIAEARRKFAEREQAKEEKAAQEEIRALEKRNQKEARKIDRGHRRSSASDGTRNKRSKSDLTMHEKDGFWTGQEYNAGLDDGAEQPRRSHTGFSRTKQNTHGTWTKFLMWFRTRLIRMGGRKKSRSQDRK